MAVDRKAARGRVATVTNWVAVGAVALTGAFAYGAAHGNRAATNRTAQTAQAPQAVQTQIPNQGYTPPLASTAPPQAISGGS